MSAIVTSLIEIIIIINFIFNGLALLKKMTFLRRFFSIRLNITDFFVILPFSSLRYYSLTVSGCVWISVIPSFFISLIL